ncbi:MAG: glycosyltransferase family 8 protein [Cyanobium sp. ELA507]
MNIVCTIDNNYVRHCAVMLRTLRDGNPGDNLRVYIVHQALDPQERAKLVGYLGSFLPSVSFLQVEPDLLEGFPVFGHISIATYFRLLLPSILPPAMDRVLFIDCDVVVNGSLQELWATPLENRPLAAASDRNLPMQRQRLEMADDAPYFNAGMMLINLEAWRREEVLSRGLAYAQENSHKLSNWDQDVLNHLFEKQALIVHQRWNAQSHLWGLDPNWLQEQGGLTLEEQEAHDNPAVIHFAGGGFAKPWNHRCPHPWKDRYREVQAMTPWANVPLEDLPNPEPAGLLRRVIRKARQRIHT